MSGEQEIVKEGQAEILFQKDQVFYNPIQEFNRDISIVAINTFAEMYLKELSEGAKRKTPHSKDGISILEGLSATGLRSIRFAKEIPLAKKIVANDFDKAAVEAIENNIKHNKVEETVQTSHGDASFVMFKHASEGKKFDVIDLVQKAPLSLRLTLRTRMDLRRHLLMLLSRLSLMEVFSVSLAPI